MKLSICYIIENENNEFFKASIKSILDVADEIIIIDGGSIDGTLKYLNSLKDDRIKIIHKSYEHDYRGANGKQRNEYLKWATGDWILVLDADEILNDNGFLLRDYMNSKFDCYNIKMIHFIGNFGQIDASEAGTPKFNPNYKHFVLRRFFKKTDKIFYPETEHPVLQGPKKIGNIEEIEVYHLGYLRGMNDIIKKYKIHVEKSQIHSPEFLRWWKQAHLLGGYPVRKIHPDEIKSEIIKEMIK